MGQETPGQTREGRLIEEAAKASGRSIRALAANAGMSDTRWRQVVRGWQQSSGDRVIEAKAGAHTLARMAIAVGLDPEALEEVGRDDAAEAQRHILAVRPPGNAASSQAGEGPERQIDEIEMIHASRTMSAEQKLRAIRIVIQLREQQREEELAARAQQDAPTRQIEASTNGEI